MILDMLHHMEDIRKLYVVATIALAVRARKSRAI